MATAGEWRRRGRGRGGVPHHRHLSRRGALRAAPALAPGAITGALQYYDGRMDDARHTLAVARTAAACGAQVVSRARVVDVLTRDGRVSGVVAADALTGDRYEVRARAVVNAGRGVGRAGAGDGRRPDLRRAPRQGRAPAVPAGGVRRRPACWPGPRTPWSSAAGGSATGCWGPPTPRTTATCAAHRGARRRGLPAAQHQPLPGPAAQRQQALGAFAGLRPLLVPVRADRATTSALSRDHTVVEAPAGLVTIVGGKYTTYRTMARDAVDACAVRWAGACRRRPPRTCPGRCRRLGVDTAPGRRPRGRARRRRRPGAAAARPLRRRGAAGAGAAAVGSRAGQAAPRRIRLPGRRVPVRRDPRAGPHPHRRAHPAYPRRHRGARWRRAGGAGGGRTGRPAARLGRRPATARGRRPPGVVRADRAALAP